MPSVALSEQMPKWHDSVDCFLMGGEGACSCHLWGFKFGPISFLGCWKKLGSEKLKIFSWPWAGGGTSIIKL